MWGGAKTQRLRYYILAIFLLRRKNERKKDGKKENWLFMSPMHSVYEQDCKIKLKGWMEGWKERKKERILVINESNGYYYKQDSVRFKSERKRDRKKERTLVINEPNAYSA